MGTITVTHLGKAYKQYPTRWSRLAEWLDPAGKPRHHLHWVLQDINFTVNPGEAVGIIGINGAGKSTLLKMITGTTQPTTGSVHITGRVAALLELGMGFHPDFTGRQNVYMAGQLLGYTVEEIAALMPEIEAFAEIGEYIDQPVRVYSSGMQVRLAFSVATAIRPDVLIVDEALSVGDVFFQQKCYDRIRNYREKGTTLLFVSHAMGTIYALCDRAILINRGRLELLGAPKEVIDLYNARLAIASNQNGVEELVPQDETIDAANFEDNIGSYFNSGVTIEWVRVLSESKDIKAIVSGSLITIRVRVCFYQYYGDPHIGFQIKNCRGEPLYMSNTAGLGQRIGPVEKGQFIGVDFTVHTALAEGDYTVTAGVADGDLLDGTFHTSLARIQNAASFTVVRDVGGDRWGGVINLSPSCSVRRDTKMPSIRVLATTSRSFLCLDISTGNKQVIHSGDGLYYGIAVSPDHVFVAARRRMVSSDTSAAQEAGVIHVFDHALRLVDTLIPPFQLRDLHGIAFDEGVLWAICSFDDMVAQWDGYEWRKWYPLGEPTGVAKDVHHFNSFYFENDIVWLLAHNRGPSELLGYSKRNLELVSRVQLGVQAHDIWREDDQLFTCSSGVGQIVSKDGFSLNTGLFPRGYSRVDDYRLVGLSELAERHQRDYTTSIIRCYDQNWELCGEIKLENEGLVLALTPYDRCKPITQGSL